MNFRQTKFELDYIGLNYYLGLDHSIDVELKIDCDFVNELNWEIRWDLRDWGIKGFYPLVKTFQARLRWQIDLDELTEDEVFQLKTKQDGSEHKGYIYGYIDISDFECEIKAIFENDQYKCEILDIDFEDKTIQIF